jgi:soluble lytic murein transglycosylase-like protein
MARGLIALVLGFATLSPAVAGTLYRCVGSEGGVTYSSSRVSGQACKDIHFAGGGRSRRGSMAAWSPSSAASSPAVGAPLAPGLPASATLSTTPPIATAANRLASASPPATRPGASQARVDFRTAPSAAGLSAPKYASGARVTRGAVYKYTHDGITNYTNVRPPGSVGAQVLFTYIETCFACGAQPGVNFATLALNTQAFANEIATASRNYGVDESLVRAIIHAESAFNPNALSYKGAQGLMQLMPDTARRFGVGNPWTAADNISGGVQYLSFLSKRFNGDVRLIAAAYNAGEGAVDRYRGVPPYAETQRYVERVGTLAERYRSGK